MTPSRESCSSCRFFRETQRSICGECRKRAPVLSPDAPVGPIGTFGRYPLESVDGWCGDYVARPARKAVPNGG
jgi:hypothetical protein